MKRRQGIGHSGAWQGLDCFHIRAAKTRSSEPGTDDCAPANATEEVIAVGTSQNQSSRFGLHPVSKTPS